jgi:hypothetical protein
VRSARQKTVPFACGAGGDQQRRGVGFLLPFGDRNPHHFSTPQQAAAGANLKAVDGDEGPGARRSLVSEIGARRRG